MLGIAESPAAASVSSRATSPHVCLPAPVAARMSGCLRSLRTLTRMPYVTEPQPCSQVSLRATLPVLTSVCFNFPKLRTAPSRFVSHSRRHRLPESSDILLALLTPYPSGTPDCRKRQMPLCPAFGRPWNMHPLHVPKPLPERPRDEPPSESSFGIGQTSLHVRKVVLGR